MNIIKFDANKHYRDVASWWDSHNWPIIPLSTLPKVGFVAMDKDDPIAAAWLYQTDSDLSILEWYISDPKSDWKKREEALGDIINAASEFAKENGFKTIFTFCNNKRLIDKLQSNKFQKTENNMTHFVRGM